MAHREATFVAEIACCLLHLHTHMGCEERRVGGELQLLMALLVIWSLSFLFLWWSSQWSVFLLAVSTPSCTLSNLCNLCVSVACSPWLPPWEGNGAIHGTSALRQDLCRLMRQDPTTNHTRLMWQATRASCFLAPCKKIYLFASLMLWPQACEYMHGNKEERLNWILRVPCLAIYMVHAYTSSPSVTTWS